MNQVPRKQLIILGVLIVVVIGVLGYQFMGAGGAPATTASKAKPAAKGAAAKKGAKAGDDEVVRFEESKVQIDDLLDAIRVVNFDYAAERVSRDPFTPLVGMMAEQAAAGEAQTAVPGSNRMEILQKKITGIVWDKFDPRAVIDDEVVSIGYTYPSGVQVYNIEEKRVTFKDGDSLIHRDLEDSAK